MKRSSPVSMRSTEPFCCAGGGTVVRLMFTICGVTTALLALRVTFPVIARTSAAAVALPPSPWL